MIYEVSKINVFYDNQGGRHVTCFCGNDLKRTIIPHLRKNHIKVWELISSNFLDFYNNGISPQKIMKKFQVNGNILFTWKVIENEIKKIAERNPKDLRIPLKPNIKNWQASSKEFVLPKTTVWDFPKRGNW